MVPGTPEAGSATRVTGPLPTVPGTPEGGSENGNETFSGVPGTDTFLDRGEKIGRQVDPSNHPRGTGEASRTNRGFTKSFHGQPVS